MKTGTFWQETDAFINTFNISKFRSKYILFNDKYLKVCLLFLTLNSFISSCPAQCVLVNISREEIKFPLKTKTFHQGLVKTWPGDDTDVDWEVNIGEISGEVTDTRLILKCKF